MDKQTNQREEKKSENLIRIHDLLPRDNVKGGSGKIVFGEISRKLRKK